MTLAWLYMLSKESQEFALLNTAIACGDPQCQREYLMKAILKSIIKNVENK